MARPIDQTCLDCSELSQPDAIALHSPSGEGRECWDAKRCPRKRSHYRNHKDNNARRLGQCRTKKLAIQSVETKESIFIPVPSSPVALLYLYRADRKNAHLHAIVLSVWQGNKELVQIEPVHCMGMTNRLKASAGDLKRSLWDYRV